MGWEGRNDRGRYYYRKRREGGRVVSEYLGKGEFAEIFAQNDDLMRQMQARVHQARVNLRQEFRRVDQSIDAHQRLVRKCVVAVLTDIGFHQHRGQWRKARTMSTKVMKPDLRRDEIAEYFKLFRAARENPAVQPQLKEYALAHPNIFDKSKLLSGMTLASVLTTMNISELSTSVISGEIDALRRNLGADTDTLLEKLLIEDVVICWVRVQLMEQVYSQNALTDQYSIIKVEHMERRLSATRRRYLQSIETLARVRRLLFRASVQINIAQQQIVAND